MTYEEVIAAARAADQAGEAGDAKRLLEIAATLRNPAPAAGAAPAQAAPTAPPEDDGGFGAWISDTAWPALKAAGPVLGDVAASGARGFRRGTAAFLGAPVDAINASPMLLNILPGTQGATPFSDSPVGGAGTLDTLLRVGGAVPDYEPQTTAGRFANRIGEELGATAVPLVGGAAKALQVGVDGARAMNPVARQHINAYRLRKI